jgi:hypothetical protein
VGVPGESIAGMGTRQDKEWLFALARVMRKPTTHDTSVHPTSTPIKADEPAPTSDRWRRWISSWFRLSEPRIPSEDRRKKEIYGLISDIVLAVLFGVVGMPVEIKWFLWFLCFCGLLYLVSSLEFLHRFPTETKFVAGVILCVAFWMVFNSIALARIIREG